MSANEGWNVLFNLDLLKGSQIHTHTHIYIFILFIYSPSIYQVVYFPLRFFTKSPFCKQTQDKQRGTWENCWTHQAETPWCSFGSTHGRLAPKSEPLLVAMFPGSHPLWSRQSGHNLFQQPEAFSASRACTMHSQNPRICDPGPQIKNKTYSQEIPKWISAGFPY